MVSDKVGANVWSCWEVDKCNRCHSPHGKIIWKVECTPDCLTGPWEVGKAWGYFEEAKGWAGWPCPSERNDPPPSSALSCPPHSPSLLLESAGENDAWGGRGGRRGDFLDVLMLWKEILKARKKSGKSRAWLFELFIWILCSPLSTSAWGGKCAFWK